jgi:parallel beta-helix repeat protein
LRLYSKTGATIDSIAVSANAEFGLVAGTLLADVQGDEKLEIVTLAEAMVVDGTYLPWGTLDECQVRVHDAALNQIGATLVTRHVRPAGAERAAPMIADVDMDGAHDLVFSTPDSVFHVVRIGALAGAAPWPHPYGNTMNTSLLAQPLKGDFSVPVSLFNTVDVIGDVVFRDATYVDAGATVRVSEDDVTAGGIDSTRCEIHIHDEFRVVGSDRQPTRIVGWNGISESNDPLGWWGLFVWDSTGTASGEFSHCELRNAANGISAREPVTVRNCLIEECEIKGISAAEADTVVVDSTTIWGSDYGINALQGTTVLLSNSSVEDCPVCGVAVYKDSKLAARATSFDGNDIGLFLARDTYAWVRGDVTGCSFTNNTDGIWIDEVGDSLVLVDDCTIDHSTTSGILVEGAGAVSITDNTITDGTVGVYSYDSSPEIRSGNTIQDNSTGIKCDNYSQAVVESCTVTSNNNAVFVLNGASPDLGHVSRGNSGGCNIFSPTTYYYVSNLTADTVRAERNYWPGKGGQCQPPASKFIGPVDRDAALCTPPSLSAPGVWLGGGDERTEPVVPRHFRLSQNYPNPFNPTTTVSYDVPKPGSRVQIAIYDVAGRLVAVLVDEHRVPGSYVDVWDGHDRRGQPVASGVYFLRMKAGSFVNTRKLLMLK